MKSTVSRWIAFGTVVLMALVSILPNMNEDILLANAALLVILGLCIMVGKQKSVLSASTFIVFGWLHFGTQVMHHSWYFSLADLPYGLTALFDHIVALPQIAVISGVALIAAQLFLRKYPRMPFILIRYAVLLFFFYNVAFTTEMFHLLALLALVNLSIELRTCSNNSFHQRRTLNTLLIALIVFWLSFTMDRDLAGWYLSVVISNNAFSIYSIICMGILGGLILMEKTANNQEQVYYIKDFKDVGAIILFWCGTALVALMFPEMNNLNVMVLAPLVLYHLYSFFIDQWRKLHTAASEKTLFYVAWSLICVLILALSKSIFLENMLTAAFLILAPVVAVIVWLLSRNNGREKETMVRFFGVAAVIALAVTIHVDPSDTFALATFILSVAILSVFWCLLCGKIYRLDSTASAVDREEFTMLAKLQKYAPLVVIVIALFKILLSGYGA